MRKLSAVLVLMLLAWPAAQAGQEPLAGNWKTTILDQGSLLTFWILKVESKDGKLSGSLVTTEKIKLPQTTVGDLTVKDGRLKFDIKFPAVSFAVDCKAPKGDAKKLHGTMNLQGQIVPVQLEATKLDTLKDVEAIAEQDPKGNFKELKDQLAKAKDDISLFSIAAALVRAAIADKAPLTDIKKALDSVVAEAAEYGNAWQLKTQLRFAQKLADSKEYAAYAETLARPGLKSAGTDANVDLLIRVNGIVATSLEKQGKKEEATQFRDVIDKVEGKGHEENEKAGLGFTPDKSEGRKGNKTVLVELFTGAQCPPCVAADLAFEGLSKTYASDEVILLQYHLHIPGPDPMTNLDTQARANFYGDAVRGTPSIFFNGTSKAGGGGPKGFAGNKYKEYRKVIDPLLEEKTTVKLSAEAKRSGDDIAVKATASGYKAGDKVKLRFVLVEPWVRYPGSNGLSYHAHVVRAMPGGPDGFTLAKDSAKETAKVNLGDLRDSGAKSIDEFPNLEGLRPFSFRHLHLVAFIQDDESKEVLAAVEVPVK